MHIKKKLVKYIIWDFDGTLYNPNEIIDPLRNLYLKTYNFITKQDTSILEFEKKSKKYKSWAGLLAHLLNTSDKNIADIIDKKFIKESYIKRNDKLVSKIESLNKYTHIILSNSNTAEVKKCLSKIGFKQKNNIEFFPFKEIVGRDHVASMKPNISGFKQIHLLTKFPKVCYLSIGDSETHDLEPAKKYGFQALHINNIDNYFSFKKETKTNQRNIWQENTKLYSTLIKKDDNFFISTYNLLLIKPILKLVKQTILDSSKILDLGCGEGFLTREIRSINKNSQINGIDISKDLLLLAKNKDSSIKYWQENLEKVTQLNPKNKYSIILSNLVIIYINNLDNYWKKISLLLEKEGRAIISLPHPCFNQENNQNWFANYDNKNLEINNYFFENKFNKMIINFKTFHYHRTLQTYIKSITKNNLRIVEIIEPTTDITSNNELIEKSKRIPFYLIFVVKKK